MYAYTDFDQQFVRQRAAQYRDQLQRHLAGELPEDEFRPLRLQNGWYVQRHAPMLRVAVPYGEISSAQLRALAHIARTFDRGYAHLTTRQNVQFNWIPLVRSADVMDALAAAGLHGIQTSGNCIRNTTTDAFAGIAPDEVVDPRPYCEILRQWTTLHPEFAFLPRKFKIAVSGAREDRTASAWHDIGLQLHRNAAGEVGCRVLVGGGMGRTPAIGVVAAEFLPWQQVLVFIEAIVRVYNRYGRRDNLYKSRIKILVKAEGQRFLDAVQTEFRNILEHDVDGAAHIIPQAELERVARSFAEPSGLRAEAAYEDSPGVSGAVAPAYRRWVERNVRGHRLAGYRAVTLSLKRVGQPPGDATAEQMEQAAALADAFSLGELRVTHEQNLVLPWVRVVDLPQLWQAARAAGYASPNRGLLTDMIACPGGDLCALANARTIPIAAAIAERFDDLDEQYDIGDVALHMSGCINSCGHHHSGHIGILGVDKDGAEWYQVTLGGADGSRIGGPATPGRVIGPSFAADEVADVVESLIDTYRAQRHGAERFIDCVRRIGIEPFKAGAYAQRQAHALTD
ncbi:MAG: nitrite/sulfite reductase [Ideonella sp.]|nr:nitrite/sulfite reductase [Ideonella sp.]